MAHSTRKNLLLISGPLLLLLLLLGACSASRESHNPARQQEQRVLLSEDTRATFNITPERAARMSWHVTSKLVYRGVHQDVSKTVEITDGTAIAKEDRHTLVERVVITPEVTGRFIEVGPGWSYVVIDFGEGVRVRFTAGGYGQAVEAKVDPQIVPAGSSGTYQPVEGEVLYYAPVPEYRVAGRAYHRIEYSGARLAFEGRHRVERTTRHVVRTLAPGGHSVQPDSSVLTTRGDHR